MTDEETMRTAELFLSLAGQALAGGGRARHGASSRRISREGDRAARRQRARRRLAGRGAGRRAGDRGLSWTLVQSSAFAICGIVASCHASDSLLKDDSTSTTAARTSCATSLEARVGKVTVDAGPQRRRQDDAAEVPDGPGAGRDRQHRRSTASDITHATPYQRARAGIGYVPQGREIFARLTVEENLRWAWPPSRRDTRIPPSCSSCSRC